MSWHANKGSTYCFLRAPIHSAEVASSHRRGGARRVRQNVNPSHWAGQSGSEGSVAAHYRQNTKKERTPHQYIKPQVCGFSHAYECIANNKSTFSERQHSWYRQFIEATDKSSINYLEIHLIKKDHGQNLTKKSSSYQCKTGEVWGHILYVSQCICDNVPRLFIKKETGFLFSLIYIIFIYF